MLTLLMYWIRTKATNTYWLYDGYVGTICLIGDMVALMLLVAVVNYIKKRTDKLD